METHHIDYTEIDNAICRFLETSDGHPTNNDLLCAMAERITGGEPWRLIDRRMQALRKSGQIKFLGRKRSDFNRKMHGWVVNDSHTSGGDQ